MKKKQLILPQHEQILEQLGQNFKLARKRRGLSMQQMAERTDCSRNTIRLIENGNSGSSIGVCFRILKVLGLQNDLLKLAQDDILGRKIQDLELLQKYNRYA